AHDRRQKAARAGSREPDERKLGAFRSWLGHHWLVARNFAVQRRIPSSIWFSFGGQPGRCRVHVHVVFYRLVAPQKNKHGKNQERDPRFENLAGGVRTAGGERGLRRVHGSRSLTC